MRRRDTSFPQYSRFWREIDRIEAFGGSGQAAGFLDVKATGEDNEPLVPGKLSAFSSAKGIYKRSVVTAGTAASAWSMVANDPPCFRASRTG